MSDQESKAQPSTIEPQQVSAFEWLQQNQMKIGTFVLLNSFFFAVKKGIKVKTPPNAKRQVNRQFIVREFLGGINMACLLLYNTWFMASTFNSFRSRNEQRIASDQTGVGGYKDKNDLGVDDKGNVTCEQCLSIRDELKADFLSSLEMSENQLQEEVKTNFQDSTNSGTEFKDLLKIPTVAGDASKQF